MSPATATACPPADLISLTVSSASLTLPALFTTTERPSDANRLAILRPMPREAPVTIAVLAMMFPLLLVIMFSFDRQSPACRQNRYRHRAIAGDRGERLPAHSPRS